MGAAGAGGYGKGFAATLAFLTAFLLDQSFKLWVEEHGELFLAAKSEGFPHVFLIYAQNSGALFGWMMDWPEPARLGVFAMAGAASLAVALLIYRGLARGEWLSAAALGLLVGGGLSNLLDRFRLGASVDLFRLPLPAYVVESAPVFNLADLFIFAGACILLLELLAGEAAERAFATGKNEPGEVLRPEEASHHREKIGPSKKNTSS
jgi:signal peptidase II